jgi:hypothetical protein
MDLGDGGGGHGFPVEVPEDLLRRSAEFAGQGLLNGCVRLRRDAVLERGERRGVGRREQVRAGRGELPGLYEDAA